jgi:hypothetical protein
VIGEKVRWKRDSARKVNRVLLFGSFFTTWRFIPREEWTSKFRRGLLILLHLHILTGDLFPGRIGGESWGLCFHDILISFSQYSLLRGKLGKTRGKNRVSLWSLCFFAGFYTFPQ